MSSLQIGRLLIGPPQSWTEQTGDSVAAVGGAAVPNQRTAPQFQAALATWAANPAGDTLAARFTIRRQLRSLLNNAALKFAGFIYVIYSDDPEQNGWYVPDQGQIADLNSPVGLATGLWQLQQPWYKQGAQRTNREARQVWMKDLRTGLYERDYLGWLLSADFAALPALQLTVLANGVTQAAATVSGAVLAGAPLPAGRDGGTCQVVQGLTDLLVVSYERPETALNLSDVVCYDRRGQISALYRQTTLADTPAGYWRYDEASGTVATDQQGKYPGSYGGGVTLSQAGALVSSGDTDTAVLLDGSSGYMQVPYAAALNPATFTYEAWVNLNSLAAVSRILHTVVGNAGAGMYVTTGGQVALQMGNGTALTTVCQSTITGGVISTFAWYHVVGTYDGATAKLYVNGTLVALGAFSGYVPASSGPLYWGSAFGSSSFLSGLLDEAAAYGYALTASQVAGHYQAAQTLGQTGSGNPAAAYGWEEVYGPDYPWNWLTAGQPADAPVLDNGLVRIRFDNTNTPGFRVDVWNGSGYVEEGKLYLTRNGDTGGSLDTTWVQAGLVEYTPDRAVMRVELDASGDAYSRERIFVSLQRGELGATFECYPALKAAGTQSDCWFTWNPSLLAGAADLNDSICKIDSQGATPLPNWTAGAAGTAAYAATAGAGNGPGNSGPFPGSAVALGAAQFGTSENWVALLRCRTAYNVISPYQATLIVLQAANAFAAYAGTDANGYGLNANRIKISSQNGAGYLQCQLAFGATAPDQINEAESIRVTGSGTTSQVADAAAVANPTTAPSGTVAAGGSIPVGTYYYVYTAFTATGETAASNVSTARTTTSGNQTINLTAASVTGATGYAWYRGTSGSGPFSFVGTSASASFSDTSATTQAPSSPSQNNTGQSSSGGLFVQESQTSGANNTLDKNVTTLLQATYRVFARVRVDPGVTGSWRLSGGATVTTMSTSWTWVDLGEISYAAAGAFALASWRSAGAAGNVYTDRVELALVTDRARSGAIFSGARDAAQAALMSAYTLGAIVAR